MSNQVVASDEKILAKLKPHPLAFASDMILWIYTIIVTLLAYLKKDVIVAKTAGVPLIGDWLAGFTQDWGIFLVVGLLVVVPVLIYSLFKVTWRPLISAIIVVGVLPAIVAYLGYSLQVAVGIVVLASVLEILRVDLKRRRHFYIVTDRRIIAEYRGFLKSSRRDIVYSRLSDIITEKGLLGKIFNFGNVYIISQASMGMGEDMGALTVGAGTGAGPVKGGVAVTGGKAVNVPISRSQYILYAVPNPEKISAIIVEALKKSEEAPYLQKILEKLDEKKEETGKPKE